jgi:hypothetical protein
MVRGKLWGETSRAFIYATFLFTALCWRRPQPEFMLLEPAEPACGQYRPILTLPRANCEAAVKKRVSVEMIPGLRSWRPGCAHQYCLIFTTGLREDIVGGLAVLIIIIIIESFGFLQLGRVRKVPGVTTEARSTHSQQIDWSFYTILRKDGRSFHIGTPKNVSAELRFPDLFLHSEGLM